MLASPHLLNGTIRCAYYPMPIWAQTYNSGRPYYREHRNSRSHGPCPSVSGSIPCEVADEQVSKLVTSVEFGSSWMEEVMANPAPASFWTGFSSGHGAGGVRGSAINGASPG